MDTVRVVKIDDWSVCFPQYYDGYKAPEQVGRALQGRVYGHCRKQDGDLVITSNIVKANGRYITTESGTVYLLGRVDCNYLDYIEQSGRVYDYDNPIKITKAV